MRGVVRNQASLRSQERPICPVCGNDMAITDTSVVLFASGEKDTSLVFTCTNCRIETTKSVLAPVISTEKSWVGP